MKRWIWITLAVLGVIGAAMAYVAIPAAERLDSARAVISGSSSDLKAAELASARADLVAARERLDSLPAKMLRFVPVVGGNIQSVRSVTDALIPVVDTAGRLERRSREFRKGGFISKGKIRISDLADLVDPLRKEVGALRAVEDAADEALTGVTLPVLWDAFTELRDRAGELRAGLADAVTLLERAPRLLGADSPRRYLVMLVNNAELRGAGGILAGVGTLTFSDGKLSLGRMYSVHDLDVEPRIRVPAPPLYERRYGIYEANTTLWLNTTFSPDLPDVAEVAARLFERTTGTKTSGAIAIDPRGLASLLEEDADLELPSFGTVEGDELPRVIYSDAYERFTDQDARRTAILQLGAAAFEHVITDGLPDDGVDAIGEAVSGGHLAFVSFDRVEERALVGVGAAHDVPPVDDDVLMVSVQNFGGGGGEGSKLDYWAKRSTEHACEITEDGGTCATSVTLRNAVPRGLTTYVAGRPYGLLRSYVEVYVPRDATLEEVRVDGGPAEFRPEPHGDMTSIGVYLEIPRGRRSDISVVYRLGPIGEEFGLVATPQPLASDARMSIAVGIPDGWTVRGADAEDGRIRVDGRFDSTIEITAGPAGRKGLSALWEGLTRFWSEPLL